jgi:hypothetical protein
MTEYYGMKLTSTLKQRPLPFAGILTTLVIELRDLENSVGYDIEDDQKANENMRLSLL